MTPDNASEDDKKFQANFETIYLSHFSGMVRFAKEYVLSKEEAENIVHDAFADIWKIRQGGLNNPNYMLAFLFTSIKNKCIDYLRRQIIVRQAETALQEEFRLSIQMKFDSLESFDQTVLSSEENIEDLIHKAIRLLPEKCREIFIKSKLEGMKQSQIAKELNISIHTVETQMVIAYKKLRQELKDYLPLMLFLLSL